jgi:hypothetical protein
MIQGILRTTVVALLVLLTCSVGPAEARYRYGSYGSATTDRGFFVEFEGLLANPRNADVVVATQEIIPGAGGVNTLSPIIPVWDDAFAGRIGLGYQWASGNKVSVSVWGFNTDRTASGNGAAGGVLHYGIGPPINTGSSYVPSTERVVQDRVVGGTALRGVRRDVRRVLRQRERGRAQLRPEHLLGGEEPPG